MAASSPISTSRAVLGWLASWCVAFGSLVGAAIACGAEVGLGLAVGLFFVAQELGTLLFVATAAARSLRDGEPAAGVLPRLSVIVAAYDEASCIADTLRSVLAQEGVELEVLVADDGSRDGTADVVESTFGERVRVLRLRHAGKGAALEAARAVATGEVLVTIDADTTLAPDALARIAAPFVDPRVEAAAGAVVPRTASELLVRFQINEYLENTLLRSGWSALGALDQVPGAFAAIRASALANAGGFPTDSLTEDYEVAYRLYAAAAREGRTILVPTVLGARAYTAPPTTLRGLVRQRTRWFAGFLSTLFRFRRLVLRASAGTFGLVRLPLKVIDAALPPIGLWALGGLALGIVDGAPIVTALSAALLVARAIAKACVQALAIDVHRARRHAHDSLPAPTTASLWRTALLEPWSYVWLKQLAVLRAYPFALRRARTWEPSRETATEREEPAPAE